MDASTAQRYCKEFLSKRGQEYEDHTESIRKEAAASRLLKDLDTMHKLKTDHAELRLRDEKKYKKLLRRNCAFMFEHHTDIFHRLVKGDMSYPMAKFAINVIRRIELGEINQEEGSLEMGRYFFQMAQMEEADRRAMEGSTGLRKRTGKSFEEYCADRSISLDASPNEFIPNQYFTTAEELAKGIDEAATVKPESTMPTVSEKAEAVNLTPFSTKKVMVVDCVQEDEDDVEDVAMPNQCMADIAEEP